MAQRVLETLQLPEYRHVAAWMERVPEEHQVELVTAIISIHALQTPNRKPQQQPDQHPRHVQCNAPLTQALPLIALFEQLDLPFAALALHPSNSVDLTVFLSFALSRPIMELQTLLEPFSVSKLSACHAISGDVFWSMGVNTFGDRAVRAVRADRVDRVDRVDVTKGNFSLVE